MSKYRVASDEGAQKFGAEIGETVDLDLSKDTETAVIAAGWLEHASKPTKEKE